MFNTGSFMRKRCFCIQNLESIEKTKKKLVIIKFEQGPIKKGFTLILQNN